MMREITWAANLPAEWTHASLRVLADIYAGGTPDKSQLEFWVGGTDPWLNSGSVNNRTITEPSAWITEAAYASSSAQWIPPQSVVIALAGQGKTKVLAARLKFRITANQSMAAIVPGPKLEYRFLQYWLTSNCQNIRNMAGGDKRDGLNLMHIGSIQCPLPSFTVQQRIADYLDREIGEIDMMIAKMDELAGPLEERRATAVKSEGYWKEEHPEGLRNPVPDQSTSASMESRTRAIETHVPVRHPRCGLLAASFIGHPAF